MLCMAIYGYIFNFLYLFLKNVITSFRALELASNLPFPLNNAEYSKLTNFIIAKVININHTYEKPIWVKSSNYQHPI